MDRGASACTASAGEEHHKIRRCESSCEKPQKPARANISRRRPVLLATASIIVVSERGERLRARALLDQGSEVSFITESLAERLELTRRFSAVPIMGVGAQRSNVARGATNFQLISRVDESFACQVDALILPKLTTCLPAALISHTGWAHLEGLRLADPDFATPSRVDVILGAHVYSQIIEEGLRRGAVGAPIAQQTCLGWIVSGSIDPDRLNKSARESPKVEAQGTATTGSAKLQTNLTNILVRWRYTQAFEETRRRNHLWTSKFRFNTLTYPTKNERNCALQVAERHAMCSPVAQTNVQRYLGLAKFLNRFRRFLS